MLRVCGVKLSIDQDYSVLKNSLIKKLKIEEKDLLRYNVFKQAIDARKGDTINFVYTVDVELKHEENCLKKCKNKDITITPDLEYKYVQTGSQPLESRPVIIGTGPAGLFAGLILAEMGYSPVILERGADVDTRTKAVRKFWEQGKLDPECNVQFGEGGAGTFSDGKLTTLIKDRRCRKVLSDFVLAGAPEEIMYSAKPHVGTDRLRLVVKKLREKIISLGGEVRFNSTVTGLITQDNQVQGVIINGNERLSARVVVLAPGHSARDVFEMLYQVGVAMDPKPFSVGVRIEHPQKLIDLAQYKKYAGHPKLGPADYKLAYHAANGRSAYTFCMCPGGVVVAATSEKGCVVTNGMSEYSRSGENANSALLVGVEPADFGSSHPLAGVEFQRKLERRAYFLGGSNYSAPAQLVGDFLENRASTRLGQVKPSYPKGVRLAVLNECLPDFVVETMRMAIPELDKKLKGFALPDAVMTGVETRSSSPVRIVRNEGMEASLKGLYPAGEGAGYAGGIVSAAVDGIKAAEAIAAKYAPLLVI
jgi:uncharacterized FAD-dependent dehydrogenase